MGFNCGADINEIRLELFEHGLEGGANAWDVELPRQGFGRLKRAIAETKEPDTRNGLPSRKLDTCKLAGADKKAM
jgi:hypothetical protein